MVNDDICLFVAAGSDTRFCFIKQVSENIQKASSATSSSFENQPPSGLKVGRLGLSNSIEWTCAKTGSQKGWNEYLGFIRTGGFFRTSTLERLMINQGHTNIVHDWVKTMGTERYLVFKAYRHSKAPETYHFNDWLSHFTEKASASEKQRMMDVFLKGTEDDRREFLRHAEAIAFDMAEEHETTTKVGRVR